MFEYIRRILWELESSPEQLTFPSITAFLRQKIGLDDFGQVMLAMPMPEFPRLSKIMPTMASDEVQINWTGNSGTALLEQSLMFVRSLAFNYVNITNRALKNGLILDYGCGYGRLARLMYYFTEPHNLFGVDPWETSIELCRQNGLVENFRKSENLPETLPLPDVKFQLIYSFSVFTHLSLHATLKAISVCRRYIAKDGVFVITVRPLEYWRDTAGIRSIEVTDNLILNHRMRGFAFYPHKVDKSGKGINKVEQEVTYGDTSISIAWIEKQLQDWKVISVDRTLSDPYQIYVFLVPV